MDSALPNLFGRATTISSQHDRLNATLDRLRRMSQALDAGKPARALDSELEPKALLDSLTSQLERHFSAEEASAYFGTLARDRPALLPQIAGLRADHTAMLDSLKQMHALTTDSERASELASLALDFARRLEQHEKLETQLVQEFFLRDDGIAGS